MNLREKRHQLPSAPGVYLMKDTLGNVIYVGKSKNLKNRVNSYFQNNKSHSTKVIKLVQNLKDFDCIVTDTEFEAFMLECRLIKEIKPAYNKQMKSPLSYSYIKIGVGEKYPRIEIVHACNREDGNMYFGPYTNPSTVEKALLCIKECCKIQCSNPSPKGSPCLNYSLGLCMGMCLDDAPKSAYVAVFDQIIALLNGSDQSIIEKMRDNMNRAVEKLDFERASKVRDAIDAIHYLISKAKVVEFTKGNQNIAMVEAIDDHAIKFFLIKGNTVRFSEKYDLQALDIEKLKGTLKDHILSYFSQNDIQTQVEIGREEIDGAQIIYSYLKSKSSTRKHVIIEEEWLHPSHARKLNQRIDQLIYPFVISSENGPHGIRP